MRSIKLRWLVLLAGAVLLLALLWRLPAVQSRLAWRLDTARAYWRGVVEPVGAAPTALPLPTAAPAQSPTTVASPAPTATPRSAATPEASPTPTSTTLPSPTPTPLPARVALPAPAWEKQGWNNCGPATLALYLGYYGWQGDQYDISAVVKPLQADRNVNVEELVDYVWNHVPGFNARFRVGGDIDLLRRFLAEGWPVMIEEGMQLDAPYWPGDDLWAGHYFLLTGYDETTQTIVGQDSYYGPDQGIPFASLDRNWKAFNRVYVLVYPFEQEDIVLDLLGPHQDFDYNRSHALEVAEAEIEVDSNDALAWFNLGSNLVFFKRYTEAAEAYDMVRSLGVPQRMWRYQFGAFMAYFHSGRTDDLLALTDYALKITEQSEEALLWRGWGRYRRGDTEGAIADFRAALEINTNYEDARYAMSFLGVNP